MRKINLKHAIFLGVTLLTANKIQASAGGGSNINPNVLCVSGGTIVKLFKERLNKGVVESKVKFVDKYRGSDKTTFSYFFSAFQKSSASSDGLVFDLLTVNARVESAELVESDRANYEFNIDEEKKYHVIGSCTYKVKDSGGADLGTLTVTVSPAPKEVR